MIIPTITHATIALVSCYLFLLFSIWWIITRKATAIFGFTCFLMLGLFLHYSVTSYLWWLEYQNVNSVNFIKENPLVIYNCAFILIPLLFYAYHVSKKFLKSLIDNNSKKDMEDLHP